MSNNQRVTGPHSGTLPLIVVLLLCAATAGGIYYLHKQWYQSPLDPLTKAGATAQAPAAH